MFYKIPELVYAPLANKGIVTGTVLVVNDQEQTLETQIKKVGCDVYSCRLDDLVEGNQINQLPKIDWLVCVTQGLGKKAEWVMDVGMKVPAEGFCLLDRISFLEPTRSRELLLTSHSLRNLIVLSPRPAFRADNKQAKDSVTSAWFIFSNNSTNKMNTEIDFALNWQRPETLCSV